MTETLYKKVNGKYVEVSYYDPVMTDAMPVGSHLTEIGRAHV